MMLERVGAPGTRAARAQLRGHLTDLHEILSSTVAGGSGEEPGRRAEGGDEQADE